MTRIEHDGTMQRRMVDTARQTGPRNWEDLTARALAARAPYRPVPGTAVYLIRADGHTVEVCEYDLDGPLRDLVTVVLAIGSQMLAPPAAKKEEPHDRTAGVPHARSPSVTSNGGANGGNHSREPTICGSHRSVVGSATSTDRRDLRAAIGERGAAAKRAGRRFVVGGGWDRGRAAAGPLVGPAVYGGLGGDVVVGGRAVGCGHCGCDGGGLEALHDQPRAKRQLSA